MEISETPILGWQKIFNRGFRNCCDICGGPFNKDGFCSLSHKKYDTYYRPQENADDEEIANHPFVTKAPTS